MVDFKICDNGNLHFKGSVSWISREENIQPCGSKQLRIGNEAWRILLAKQTQIANSESKDQILYSLYSGYPLDLLITRITRKEGSFSPFSI